MAQRVNLRCVSLPSDPGSVGAGGPNQNTSRIKKFIPHLLYDCPPPFVFIGPLDSSDSATVGVTVFDPRVLLPAGVWPAVVQRSHNRFSDYKAALYGAYGRSVHVAAWDRATQKGFSVSALAVGHGMGSIIPSAAEYNLTWVLGRIAETPDASANGSIPYQYFRAGNRADGAAPVQTGQSNTHYMKSKRRGNLDPRCVLISDPSTLGAGAKPRLESSINKFKPHLNYDSFFSGQDPGLFLPHFPLYEVAPLHMCVLPYKHRTILEMLLRLICLWETMGSRPGPGTVLRGTTAGRRGVTIPPDTAIGWRGWRAASAVDLRARGAAHR